MDGGGRSLLCAAADRNTKTRNPQLKNSQLSIASGDNS